MADWRTLARRAAQKHGIDQPDIFVRQMGAEAAGRDVRSPAGALGPAQIMPATARAWGVRNPHNIVEAYDAAAKHMAGYIRQFGSDPRRDDRQAQPELDPAALRPVDHYRTFDG
jgi:soluble lytic murein transglycosylase-like protein